MLDLFSESLLNMATHDAVLKRGSQILHVQARVIDNGDGFRWEIHGTAVPIKMRYAHEGD